MTKCASLYWCNGTCRSCVALVPEQSWILFKNFYAGWFMHELSKYAKRPTASGYDLLTKDHITWWWEGFFPNGNGQITSRETIWSNLSSRQQKPVVCLRTPTKWQDVKKLTHSFLVTSWCFQPIWKIFVNLEYFPKIGMKNKRIFELPPPTRFCYEEPWHHQTFRPNTKTHHFCRAAKAFAVVQSCEGKGQKTSYGFRVLGP